MMPPLFCLLVTGSFGIIFEYTLEQFERRRYRNILDRYVSKNVAKAILADRRSLEESIGGRKKPVTILFTDIRSFTTMTESSDADKLVAQLNEYFERHGGSHSGKQPARCKNSLATPSWRSGATPTAAGIDGRPAGGDHRPAMRPALAKLNPVWKDNSDRRKLSIGIGVNHGEVIIGNVGHPQRMELTVLGDGVNLAARLESATKQFHTDILVGEEVEKLTREHFVFRAVDLLTVKGKTKPVEVLPC